MAAMLGVASGRGSRLKMIIIWIHNTSLCGGEYRNRVNHVDSSESEMTYKKLNASIFPAYPKEVFPRYCFLGCLLEVVCHQFNFILPDTPLFKVP